MKKPYVRIQQPTLHRLITVVNNVINFTPKLLVKNEVGSWSADNLPSGVVFNSLTGAISGVLTKTGCNFVHLTYTEGECKDTVIVPIYTVDKIRSDGSLDRFHALSESLTTRFRPDPARMAEAAALIGCHAVRR